MEPASKPEMSLLIQKVDKDQKENQPEPKFIMQAQPADLKHLEEPKLTELCYLLDRYFLLLFHQRPGKT